MCCWVSSVNLGVQASFCTIGQCHSLNLKISFPVRDKPNNKRFAPSQGYLMSRVFVCCRAANLYFLFLALLNWVPVVEAFQKEITMLPLLVVLIVIAIKDALEDYRRYLFDKKVNNNIVQVFCG